MSGPWPNFQIVEEKYKLALSLHKFRNYPEKCGGGTAPFLTLLLRVALSRLNLPGYCLKCPNQDEFHEIHQWFCSCPSPFAFSGGNASVAAPSPLVELLLNRIVPPAAERQNRSFEGTVAAALRAGHALRGLRRLELVSNHLLYLPRDVLAQLPGLRHLDLRNNSLVSLTYVSFRNLTHLESLHLENNALKVLHNGTLAELQSLPHVRVFLDDNPWVCDCHMADMVAWLKETEVVQGKARLTCAFPEKMRNRVLLELDSSDLECDPILPPSLQTSYVFLGIVLALIGAIFLLVLYLNRKGIKKWMHNIRDACRDHMEGYHYRYEINADPRLTNLSSNSDV
ncbi:hypothetical protein E2I00_017328 [Balaenoptera physalus]|uniref:LRRCT domain-containing protein n=1 Tax=Balaenoptera physalus TaxID=9770 RepID=A0A643C7K9_BALPH|nr:hypothetical protein E2I00_017328 [Balaenoptera physalus]